MAMGIWHFRVLRVGSLQHFASCTYLGDNAQLQLPMCVSSPAESELLQNQYTPERVISLPVLPATPVARRLLHAWLALLSRPT